MPSYFQPSSKGKPNSARISLLSINQKFPSQEKQFLLQTKQTSCLLGKLNRAWQASSLPASQPDHLSIQCISIRHPPMDIVSRQVQLQR